MMEIKAHVPGHLGNGLDHSSITLFVLATPGERLFTFALEKYSQGQKDKKTVELLGLKA